MAVAALVALRGLRRDVQQDTARTAEEFSKLPGEDPGADPVRGQRCAPKTSTPQRGAPLRLIRASAVTKETWRASARATYCAS